MSDIFDEITLLKDEVSSIRRIGHESFSVIIGNYWLFTFIILLIISLLTRQVPLLLISMLFLLTGGIARLWDRYCFSRFEYRRRVRPSRAFFGDQVHLEIEFSNRKLLPLPWVQIDEEIPLEITLLSGKTSPSHRPMRVFLNDFVSMGWYHRITRRYPLLCTQRGLFQFGPTSIRSGDLFGIFHREMETYKFNYLLVYPKIVSLEKLGIPSRQAFGDIRTRQHIFEDPVLTMGVRDYRYGDSLKRINWKATARVGKLQTRVYEPTTTTDMSIFLDVRTIKPFLWGSRPELLELVVISAASIANYAISIGYRTGLYANHRKRIPDEPIRIPPGQHKDQLMRILESLAQVTPFETMSIDKLVQNESRNLPWGSTVVVITATPTDALLSTLYNMKRIGRRVVLILVGGTKTAVSEDSLTVYHIPEDIPWQDIETLPISGV
jgi:uncharacterized protein (DUF58 family)